VTGQPLQQLLGDGRVLPQRAAQIAVQQYGTHPASVLNPHRLVETESLLELLAAHLGSRDVVLAQHQVDDVAGNHAHGHEDDETGEEQSRNERQNAANDVSLHQPFPPQTAATDQPGKCMGVKRLTLSSRKDASSASRSCGRSCWQQAAGIAGELSIKTGDGPVPARRSGSLQQLLQGSRDQL
jgi:hypothetical protein